MRQMNRLGSWLPLVVVVVVAARVLALLLVLVAQIGNGEAINERRREEKSCALSLTGR